MEKFKKIMGIILGIGVVVGLVISSSSYMKVSAVEELVGYDNHIISTFDNNEESVAACKVLSQSEATINLEFAEDKIVVVDSKIIINGETDIVLNLKESHVIEYDYSLDFVKIDNRIIIKTINSNDVTKENISQFLTDENQAIVLGQKQIDETTGISIVIETDDENKEADLNLISDLMNNISIHNGKMEMTFMGQKINNAWNQELLIANNVISIGNGSDYIYIAPFL